ncbi:MAG: hypothetical protein CM1200mP16_16840 [Nitrospina sp.]|nr:MAG: hypothetical protein CM1200mP16_16840 [Nitrospina sp.]
MSEDMIETTLAAPGIGLAANQIGIPWRIFVVNMGFETENDNLIILNLNPGKITAIEGSELGEEGCLSIPDVVAKFKSCYPGRIKSSGPEWKGCAL